MNPLSVFSFILLGVTVGAFTAAPSSSTLGRPETSIQASRRLALSNIAFGLSLPHLPNQVLDRPRKGQVSLSVQSPAS
jgi:hypothetical protein